MNQFSCNSLRFLVFSFPSRKVTLPHYALWGREEKWDTIETCEISGSQVGEYEDDDLLGYSAV